MAARPLPATAPGMGREYGWGLLPQVHVVPLQGVAGKQEKGCL